MTQRTRQHGAGKRWWLLASLCGFAGALTGAWGSTLQTVATVMALVAVVVIVVETLLQLGVFLCSRPEYGPSMSEPDHEPILVRAASTPSDSTATALQQAVDASRLQELLVGERYEAGMGAAEDVIRAKAIRLKAEIDLIRHLSPARTQPLAPQ